MDLRSSYPFWLVRSGLLGVYPALADDLECEVVVIGAGITGALIVHVFLEHGVDVVVLDKRDVAWGSTSASTAMLQYEIDKELHELISLVGEEDASRSYLLGVEAIEALTEIVAQLGVDCSFRRVESIYATRNRRSVNRLRSEYEARKACGLQVEWADEKTLCREYGLAARAAIVSQGSAQMDPYRLAHALFADAQARGVRIFDRTAMTQVVPTAAGVTIETDRDCQVRAKKVVFATGYETQQYLKQKVVNLNSTYALVTEPLEQEKLLPREHLMWETARPYFYMRTNSDGRLVMGGGDEPFRDPERRDKLIGRKAKKLLKDFARFYPAAPELEIAYAWAGTFGETKDGLAYIGETDEAPHAFFALGYGGNGITYSMIAAGIIRDLFLGKENRDAHIFRFDR